MIATLIKNVTDEMPKVWLELVLASIAAFLYFSISRKQAKQGSKSSADSGTASLQEEQQKKQDDQDLQLSQSVLKALRKGQIIEAVNLTRKMAETAAGHVPNDIALRLIATCSKTPMSADVKNDLKLLAGKIEAQALEAALADALRNKDVAACRQLHMISGLLSIPKSQLAFEHLARAYLTDAPALRVLVEQAALPLGKQFAKLALEACANSKDNSLTSEILEKADSADLSFLRGVVENSGTSPRESGEAGCTGDEDTPIAKPQVESHAADALIRTTTLTTPKEITMRANDIRSCGKNGDLQGAMKVFDRLGDQANSTLIFNSMLDACVECKDLTKAVEYFERAKQSNLLDVISYNTLMKGYIANGQEAAAKQLLEKLTNSGLSVTRTSFHGLLNARVNARDFNGAWKLVSDMQSAGVSPNAVTGSILLKGRMNTVSDVSRVLALIDAMDEPMDEVLFLSVVEACIRTGRLDLLSKQTEKFMRQDGSALTAPTYGSMIKAYGQARDLKRVWDLWNQMITRRVQPTAVTLGCMVEALVANGQTVDAWQLAQKMSSEEGTEPLVNTVIYSSILKGLAYEKDTEKVMTVYEEMKLRKVQPNTITFNTILNAFAQTGAMHRVPELLEDMKATSPPVEPDIVTYSTIVKGFCNAGNLDRALRVLDDMKDSGKHKPDEVMYNSLLAGCAKEHRPDDAIQLLSDMKKYNVAPSNYTLSMLVKLMGRCRRINQAFTMLEDISKEYGLKINIQVYTCLIQGCFNANQAGKALALHEKIIKEGIIPDSMTYTVLVRGCQQAGLLDKAVDLAKCASGLGPLQPPKGNPPGLNIACYEELLHAVGESKEHYGLLAELQECRPRSNPAPSGKGKGKGGARYDRW